MSKNEKSDLDIYIRTTVYLTPSLHEILREMAYKRKVTISSLIRQAIAAWLDQEARR